MLDFEIHVLSAELLLIRWLQIARPESETAFIQALRQHLDNTASPLYFISDLRKGHITNVAALRRLGRLTEHPNWGGGVSYGEKLATDMYVDTFASLSTHKTGDHMAYKISDAVTFLEQLKPGLTKGIDWHKLFEKSPQSSQSQV
jgi:hypothetical protein